MRQKVEFDDELRDLLNHFPDAKWAAVEAWLQAAPMPDQSTIRILTLADLGRYLGEYGRETSVEGLMRPPWSLSGMEADYVWGKAVGGVTAPNATSSAASLPLILGRCRPIIAWLLRGDVAHWIGMLCVVMYMVHMDMEMDMHSTST